MWKKKFIASGVHLLVSLVFSLMASVLVFFVWYPYPFGEISGGQDLFKIIIAVDIVLGPLLTFVIFNNKKPRKELVFDISVVGIIQIVALAYGLWAVSIARPIHVVFEYDRFRVIHALDISEAILEKSGMKIPLFSFSGPTYISLRPMKGPEQFDLTFQAFSGVEISGIPDLWQPYEAAYENVIKTMRPINDLSVENLEKIKSLKDVKEIIKYNSEIGFIPLTARKNIFWTAIVDGKTANVLAIVPVDSFEVDSK